MSEATIDPKVPDVSGGSGPPRRMPRLMGSRKELGIFVLLLVVCAITYWRNPSFLSPVNVQDMARLVGIYGIFAIGAGIVIATGGIDLSVGSIFALEGVILAIALNNWHVPWVFAVLGSLVFCMALGLIHGLLITKVPLQPFIVTLCGLMIYRGMARFISGDETEGFADATHFQKLADFTTGIVAHVPAPFIIMIVVAVVFWVIVHRSVWGRYVFAVGRNEEASRYSGINSSRIIVSVYVLSALLSGIAGILLAFYTSEISPSSHGLGYELYGIAAAVLGGCSLRGGEGSIIGILIGTTLLQVLQNLVNILGIPSSLNLAVVGTVILLGVISDEVFKKRAARRAQRAS